MIHAGTSYLRTAVYLPQTLLCRGQRTLPGRTRIPRKHLSLISPDSVQVGQVVDFFEVAVQTLEGSRERALGLKRNLSCKPLPARPPRVEPQHRQHVVDLSLYAQHGICVHRGCHFSFSLGRETNTSLPSLRSLWVLYRPFPPNPLTPSVCCAMLPLLKP